MEPLKNKTRATLDYEYKMLMSELCDVDVKNGIVTGYFAGFNNIDSDGDMIMPNAFDKTIAERGPSGTNQIYHLLQHNTTLPLGIPSVLKPDQKGLYFENKITPTSYGKDALLLYEAGVYKEHSIGYRIIQWEAVEDSQGNAQYYKLHELKLWEGSTVTWGANDQTPFTGMKSIAALSVKDAFAELDSRKKRILKGLKTTGLTDETYVQLELTLEQIISGYKLLASNSLDNSEAARSGTSGDEPKPLTWQDIETII